MSLSNINIKNKKAWFEYELLDKYIAGIQLTGTEIKSLREGKANLTDGFCTVLHNEIWMINTLIAEYTHGSHTNHEPKRKRKLLLNRQEIDKLKKKLKDKGITLIPLRLFINEKGLAKVEIALAKGKKLFDKRESIKAKDVNRQLDRLKKTR
ncbi:MAG: SsrA-binding protein SmpB [Flavobacteriales bacterium]|nr:SsrA-binding protein SmpB [Flavobacteriales bacterium]